VPPWFVFSTWRGGRLWRAAAAMRSATRLVTSWGDGKEGIALISFQNVYRVGRLFFSFLKHTS